MTASRSLSAYLAPAVALASGLWIGSHMSLRPRSDLVPTAPGDVYTQRMLSLPLYQSLSNESQASSLHLLCPFDIIPDYLRERHLLAGTLNGKDTLLMPPMIFVDERRAELVGFYALGQGLSGHTDTIHGGMIAALFDEMLAFTAMPQLPGRVFALTSYLTVRYLSRVPTGSLVALHTETVGFHGEYDRKVLLRAVLVDAGAPISRDDFRTTSTEVGEPESFSQFQKRMQKKFARDKLHCVAEAEFVVPRQHAFWLYWTDLVKSLVWRSSSENRLEHRYRLPNSILRKKRNGNKDA